MKHEGSLRHRRGGRASTPVAPQESYVPSDQLARYSSCSEVKRSILMPSDSSLSLATRLSRSTGTVYTFFSCDAWFFTMYSHESAWSAKLMSITDAGCPSAAARLITRPSPSRLKIGRAHV